MRSGHYVRFEFFWIFALFILIIIVVIFKNVMSAAKFEVSEDLPNFFEAIDLHKADAIVYEE